MEHDWEDRYQKGDTPWDSGQPSAELMRVLDEYSIPPGPTLELGCGTGNNCVYLASLGFEVTGIDLSPTAIAAAKKRADDSGVSCKFMVADILEPPDLGGPFSFIFDRGCFHAVRQIDEPRVVTCLKDLLAPGGYLLVLTGNTHETAEEGPPKVSEQELRHAFSDQFEILHLREFRFDIHPGRDFRPLAWSTLLKKRFPE